MTVLAEASLAVTKTSMVLSGLAVVISIATIIRDSREWKNRR